MLCYFLQPLPAYNSPAPATPTTTENHRHQFQHFSFPNFSLSIPPPHHCRSNISRSIRTGLMHRASSVLGLFTQLLSNQIIVLLGGDAPLMRKCVLPFWTPHFCAISRRSMSVPLTLSRRPMARAVIWALLGSGFDFSLRV